MAGAPQFAERYTHQLSAKIAREADLWYNEASKMFARAVLDIPSGRMHLNWRYTMDTLPPHAQNGKVFIIFPPLSKSHRHYVYTLAYPDGNVFYVGKGTNKRIFAHEEEARSGRTENPYKCNVIRKIWNDGGEVLKTIIAYFVDEQDALRYELALIFFMDGLTNLNAGGTGQSNPTQETRKKMSEARKKRVLSEETRRKYSERLKGNQYSKGRTRSDETRKKLSDSHKGKHYGIGRSTPEETRKKLSDAMKGRIISEEHRRKISESLQGHPGHIHNEETRRKISTSLQGHTFNKGRKHSEEAKYNMGLAHRGLKHSEETKQKLSELAKKRGGRPHTEETRLKLSMISKGKTLSEDARLKISEAQKKRWERVRNQSKQEENLDGK